MEQRRRIGDLLVERGAISKEDLEAAVQEAAGERLGESLLGKGLVSREDLGTALQSLLGVTYAGSLPESVDPEVLRLVPAAVAHRCCALPLTRDEVSGSLVVAMAEPQNVERIKELQFSSGMKISPQLSFRSDVIEGIRRSYGNQLQSRRVVPPAPEPGIGALRAPNKANGRRRAAVFTTFCGAMVAGWVSGYIINTRSIAPVRESFPPAEIQSQLPELSSLSVSRGIPPLSAVSDTDEISESPPARTEPLQDDFASPARSASGRIQLQAEATAQQESGYLVQVGVFRSRVNAERLAESLRTYAGEVRSSLSQNNLYAVTVGPFAEVEAAAETRDRIAEELHILPIVVRTPL